MKALTTFIAIALLAFSTTACSQQHTYRSGGFGSKTVKASKNYVTKDIKVDNFTKLSVAGSPRRDLHAEVRETDSGSIYLGQHCRFAGYSCQGQYPLHRLQEERQRIL